jgi:6-pyruvoyltetrahydropterin/6-carboxytetrahydropterin synthase
MKMYSVSLREKFISQHFLPHETGKESVPHSHHYFVEVCLFGEKLDDQGFLFDIVDLKHVLLHLLEEFRDRLLNDFDEFRSNNPTLENVAHLFWIKIAPRLKGTNVSSMRVTVWEEEHIYASFEEEIAT